MIYLGFNQIQDILPWDQYFFLSIKLLTHSMFTDLGCQRTDCNRRKQGFPLDTQGVYIMTKLDLLNKHFKPCRLFSICIRPFNSLLLFTWEWLTGSEYINICVFHSCIRLFSSSVMNRSVLLVLLCLQVFLLISTFTSSDAAALVADDQQQQPLDLVRRSMLSGAVLNLWFKCRTCCCERESCETQWFCLVCFGSLGSLYRVIQVTLNTSIRTVE